MYRNSEKIAVSQLTSYLVTNNILNDTQHAYLPGRSTETALTSAVTFITQHIDMRQVVSLASVDLSSPFDCVKHGILLRKLGWSGIDPTRFSYYLSNRHQRVRGGTSVQPVRPSHTDAFFLRFDTFRHDASTYTHGRIVT